MKERLVEKGMPEDVITDLPEQKIQELYENSIDKNIYTETITMSMNEGESEIQPYGHIDDDMLDMSVTCSTFAAQDGKVNCIYVFVIYLWEQVPIIQKTDGIAINWDESLFAYEDDSFNSYCQATDDLDSVMAQWYTYYRLDRPDLVEQGGLGYSVSLMQYKYEYITYFRGSAHFDLLPKDTIYVDSEKDHKVTAINMNYTHDRTPLFGSISFQISGFGVTINAPALNDTASDTVNFYYYDQN